MPQIINPKSEEDWLALRTKDITSTEIAALFGLSPYVSQFELWHRKKEGVSVVFDPNERTESGLHYQDAIAQWFVKHDGLSVRRMSEYIRLPEERLGSSFDFAINEEGILEIKNVDGLVFRNDWIMDGDNIEAPTHLEIQVQQQLLVSGRKYAYFGVCVGGNKHYLIKREPDHNVFNAIRKRAAEFWKSIDENNPPPPNFEVDAEFIASLYRYAEPGKVLNVVEDKDVATMAQEYKALGDAIKTAEQGRDEIKAKLLMRIGDAEKVLGDGFTISANVVGPAHVEYERAGYRSFKVTWKKGATK